MLDQPKTRLKGIDVDALKDVAEAVAADSAKGQVGFEVTTRWAGQTRSETTVEAVTVGGQRVPRSHLIVADEPKGLLGSDDAANPQELLMAGLNACLIVGYVAGAAVRDITLDRLEIRTSGKLDMRGFLGLDDQVPPGYESLGYEVTISGDGTAEQFDEIHRRVAETSPNYFNLNSAVPLHGTLRLV